MRKVLVCIFLSLGYLLGSSITQAQSDPASEVIQRVNGLRVSYGLPAYQIDSVLMYVAQTQASWSAENNHIGHDGPGAVYQMTGHERRAMAVG